MLRLVHNVHVWPTSDQILHPIDLAVTLASAGFKLIVVVFMTCQDQQSAACFVSLFCLAQVSEQYTSEMVGRRLPMEVADLEEQHATVAAAALQRFDREKFGSETGASVGKLR